jgi:hypothetical protein
MLCCAEPSCRWQSHASHVYEYCTDDPWALEIRENGKWSTNAKDCGKAAYIIPMAFRMLVLGAGGMEWKGKLGLTEGLMVFFLLLLNGNGHFSV